MIKNIKIKRRRKSTKNFPPKKKGKRKSDTNYTLKKKDILYDSNTGHIMYQKNDKTANQLTIDIDEKKNKENDYINYKNILKYTPNELNDLDYKHALIHDKRNYVNYYLSLLRNGHLFFFSFFKNNDYNSPIIKKLLFFLLFQQILLLMLYFSTIQQCIRFMRMMEILILFIRFHKLYTPH